MFLQIPQALGGPVLHWELMRSERRLWCCLLHYGFLVWLLFQTVVLLDSAGEGNNALTKTDYAQRASFTKMGDRRAAQRTRISGCVSYLLYQQLAIILLLTPVLAAGALGYEKEQDTLTALLGTQLQAREIVAGKFLGRMVLLLRIVLAPLPIVILLGIVAEQSLGRVLLAEVQAVVVVFALVAAAILTGVWTRRTSDAILGCYALIVIGYLIGESLLSNIPFAEDLEPLTVLRRLLTEDRLRPIRFAFHLLAWLAAGLICLALARRQLRKATIDQMERRPSGWVWAIRPTVNNDPVRWRERYVIGLAPLPILRMIPVWLGMLSVFTFSTILAFSPVLNYSVATSSFVRALIAGRWGAAFHMLREIVVQLRFVMTRELVAEDVTFLGIVLVVAAILVVGVRCFTSLAEEKRRKTWDDLLLTALPLKEIMRSKRLGVTQATIPYLVIYSLPMFGLGYLGGLPGLTAVAIWLLVAYLAVVGTAWFASEVAPESWDMEGFERKSPIGQMVDSWGP